jgi:DNA-binding NarL/FixJ family response regulator
MMVYLKSSRYVLLNSLHKESGISTEETALILSELEDAIPWIMVYSNAEKNEIIRALDAGCRDAIN